MNRPVGIKPENDEVEVGLVRNASSVQQTADTPIERAIARYAAGKPQAQYGRLLTAHLQRLEDESIEIIREVVAEFRKPVMLYSIGKDSSVMLHIARKAFFPSKLPFPLLHVDTTWKFREMIAFREATAIALELELLVHVNRDGLDRGINPIDSGSSLHTQVMKTEARKRAAPRSEFSRSGIPSTSGIPAINARNCGTSTTPGCAGVNRFGFFRYPTGLRWTSGPTLQLRKFR